MAGGQVHRRRRSTTSALFSRTTTTPSSTSTARSTAPRPTKLPVSLGSDDALTVWLNGEKLAAPRTPTARCAPTRTASTLKLKPGKNDLLLKIVPGRRRLGVLLQAAGEAAAAVTWAFEDVSDEVGLGPNGVGGDGQGRHADRLRRQRRRPARLPLRRRHGRRSSATRGKGFVEVEGHAASLTSRARSARSFGDFDGDGQPDLFVPQHERLQAVPQRRQGHASPT